MAFIPEVLWGLFGVGTRSLDYRSYVSRKHAQPSVLCSGGFRVQGFGFTGQPT